MDAVLDRRYAPFADNERTASLLKKDVRRMRDGGEVPLQPERPRYAASVIEQPRRLHSSWEPDDYHLPDYRDPDAPSGVSVSSCSAYLHYLEGRSFRGNDSSIDMNPLTQQKSSFLARHQEFMVHRPRHHNGSPEGGTAGSPDMRFSPPVPAFEVGKGVPGRTPHPHIDDQGNEYSTVEIHYGGADEVPTLVEVSAARSRGGADKADIRFNSIEMEIADTAAEVQRLKSLDELRRMKNEVESISASRGASPECHEPADGRTVDQQSVQAVEDDHKQTNDVTQVLDAVSSVHRAKQLKQLQELRQELETLKKEPVIIPAERIDRSTGDSNDDPPARKSMKSVGPRRRRQRHSGQDINLDPDDGPSSDSPAPQPQLVKLQPVGPWGEDHRCQASSDDEELVVNMRRRKFPPLDEEEQSRVDQATEEARFVVVPPPEEQRVCADESDEEVGQIKNRKFPPINEEPRRLPHGSDGDQPQPRKVKKTKMVKKMVLRRRAATPSGEASPGQKVASGSDGLEEMVAESLNEMHGTVAAGIVAAEAEERAIIRVRCGQRRPVS